MKRANNTRKKVTQNRKRNIDDSSREVTEILRVKKKYSFKYIMLYKLIEFNIIFLILAIIFILRKSLLSVFFTLFLYVVLLAVSLILYKKSAENTYISFQEKKVVYRRKFLFINKKDELLYDEIKSISLNYEPTWYGKFWQKKLNLANLVIYPKKGLVFMYGMELSCVGPFDKILNDLQNNIGDKIK